MEIYVYGYWLNRPIFLKQWLFLSMLLMCLTFFGFSRYLCSFYHTLLSCLCIMPSESCAPLRLRPCLIGLPTRSSLRMGTRSNTKATCKSQALRARRRLAFEDSDVREFQSFLSTLEKTLQCYGGLSNSSQYHRSHQWFFRNHILWMFGILSSTSLRATARRQGINVACTIL